MGSWATLYVQTPMVQEGGALCLPIAHSLPSTIPVLQSPNSATCHWCRTYVLRASSAPRHNSRGTDVASALIFLTPLCPLTPLSDSVLQGLMTEVCTQPALFFGLHMDSVTSRRGCLCSKGACVPRVMKSLSNKTRIKASQPSPSVHLSAQLGLCTQLTNSLSIALLCRIIQHSDGCFVAMWP